jgi:hypothetical protein
MNINGYPGDNMLTSFGSYFIGKYMNNFIQINIIINSDMKEG